MKKLYFTILMCCVTIGAIMAQTTAPPPGGKLSIKGVSAKGACDGGAAFDAGTITSWEWFQDSTSLQVGGDTIFNLCEGNYSVHYPDSAGTNTIVDNFTIGIDSASGGGPGPGSGPSGNVNIQACSAPTVCDGSAMFNPPSGVTSWEWFQDSTFVQTGGSLDSLCEGNYSIMYNDASGSNVKEDFYVNVAGSTTTPPGPSGGRIFNIFNTSASGKCDGSAEFDSNGLTSWKWFKGSVEIQVGGNMIDSLCAGDYSVQFPDSSGTNSIVENFFISEPTSGGPDPGPSGSRVHSIMQVSDSSKCDGSAKFDSNGLTSWKWFQKDGTQIQIGGDSINSLCMGDYYVEYPDSSGTNSLSDFFHIGFGDPSGPPPGPDPGPNGGRVMIHPTSSATACDGSADFDSNGLTSWKWLKEDGTQIQVGGNTIDGLCEGNYKVEFPDSSGTDNIVENFYIGFDSLGNNNGGGPASGSGTCPDFEAHAVTNSATSATACDGTVEIVVTSSGVAPITYSWSDNSTITDKIRNGLCVGDYSFTATDSKGCTYTDTAKVAGVDPVNLCGNFKAHVLPTNESTKGACDGKAEVFADGGVAPYTYDWMNSNITTKVHPNLCSGHYEVKVTDGNNCTATSSIDILADSVNSTNPCEFFRVRTFVVSDTSADGSTTCSGYVEATCKGFSGPLTFSWSDDSSNNTAFRHDACEGDYVVTVSDSAGCSATVKTFVGKKRPIVSTPPAPGVEPLHIFVNTKDVTNSSLCNGEAHAKIMGGTAPYEITFGAETGTGSTYVIDSLCEGFYTIEVMDADSSRAEFVFVIGSPANTYTPPTPKFVNPVIKDTLVASAISTCEIDYDAIDSILITGVTQVGTDSVKCIWTVFQSGGNKDSVTQHYQADGTGIFNFVLDLFCTNRASGSVKAEDQVEVGTATGIEEEAETIISTLYPNPFTSEINITIDENATVIVIDVTGRTVYSGTINAGTSTIDTDQFNSGMYFITISTDTDSITKKIIKQ